MTDTYRLHPPIDLSAENQLRIDSTEGIHVAHFSPDGRTLVTVQDDEVGIARIWDIPSLTCVRECSPQSPLVGVDNLTISTEPFEVYIESCALTTDGRLVLLGINDGTVHIYSVADGVPLGRLHDPNREPAVDWSVVRAVCFSPDDTLMAAGFIRGVVGVWRVTDQALLAAFQQPDPKRWSLDGGPRPSLATSIAFTIDSKHLFAAFADERAYLWDLASAETLCASHEASQETGSISRRLQHWSTSWGNFPHVSDGPRGWKSATCLSQDGRFLLSKERLVMLDDKPRTIVEIDFPGFFVAGCILRGKC